MPGPADQAVHLIDADDVERSAVANLLLARGLHARTYHSPAEFLTATRPTLRGCVLVAHDLPLADGIAFTQRIKDLGYTLPVVVLDGSGVRTVVSAMRAGAQDFIERPVSAHELLAVVADCLEKDEARTEDEEARGEILRRFARLTARERQVAEYLAAGRTAKQIARDLGISPRTIEAYRAAAFRKLDATGLADLARMALAADLIPRSASDIDISRSAAAASNVLELRRA